MKSIIICTTQRSGSTLFCKDLNLTGKLGNAGEWFYRLGWTKNLDPQQNELQVKLNNLLNTCKTDNGIYTVKIMANYYQKVSNNLKKITDYNQEEVESVFDKLLPQPQYIRIYRVNKIKQAISLLISRKTGVYHSFQGKMKSIKKSDLSLEQVNNVVQELTEGEQKWDVFFHRKGIKPITIIYENYIEDPLYHLEKVASAVNIKIDHFNSKKRIKKVSNRINEEIYDDYLKSLEADFTGNYIKLL